MWECEWEGSLEDPFAIKQEYYSIAGKWEQRARHFLKTSSKKVKWQILENKKCKMTNLVKKYIAKAVSKEENQVV